MAGPRLTRYPAHELLRFVDPEMSDHTLAEVLGVTVVTVRTWKRANRANLINAYDADRYATRLGLHPWMVWGDSWFQIRYSETVL